MDKRIKNHWGTWVNARATHVGITRKMELAQIVGCRREQVSRWIAMPVPPVQLRKGFDHKLAYALQTTREMLLKGWESTPAEKADRVVFHSDQLPLTEENSWNPVLADLWKKLIPYLAPSELEWLLLQAALKVMEKRDFRAEIFRPILDRFKLFEHYERTGERLPVPPAGAIVPTSTYSEKTPKVPEPAPPASEVPTPSKLIRKPSKPPTKPQ